MAEQHQHNLSQRTELKPLELSGDFKYVLDVVETTSKHLFVTGKAGTGKSTLLQLFRNTTRKKTVVLAPTGIAALNVRGQTIHSFFRFPPKVIQADDIHKSRNTRMYKNIDVIVIDEISMVRADLLDGIDRFLQLNRGNSEPFGGVQMVFFGDLFQLPPVVSRPAEKEYFSTYYNTPYFFSAHVFTRDVPFEMVELGKIYRQEERHFIRLLDGIRMNSLDYEELTELNERHIPDFAPQGNYITLCSVNALADSINKKNLRELETPEQRYHADVTGDFRLKYFPTQQILDLKIGAQVMLLRNDPQRRFVNGSIAVITDLAPDLIKVRVIENGEPGDEIDLEKHTWEMITYRYTSGVERKLETHVSGTFHQFPIKLAWAITIHKSQGKTFDRVLIDLGRGAFEYGQTYVALSRCRTLSGIVLKQPLRPRDIMVDTRITEYFEGMRRYLR